MACAIRLPRRVQRNFLFLFSWWWSFQGSFENASDSGKMLLTAACLCLAVYFALLVALRAPQAVVAILLDLKPMPRHLLSRPS